MIVEDMNPTMKIIVVGNGKVGKTTLTIKFVKNIFTSEYKKTLGVDFLNIKKYVKEIDREVDFYLWDTAGQDYYNAITRRYYKGADAALIVFSVTDKDSFTNVNSWYDKVVNECDHIPMILVMSKIDLINEGVVKEEDAIALSRQLGLELIKVSSKDGVMVNEVFEKLAIKHFKGGNVSNGPDNIENVTKGIVDNKVIGNNGEDVKEFENKEAEVQKSVRSNKEEKTGFKLVGEIQGEKKKKKKCCRR